MNQKIYIETSIVSYLTARPSKDLVIAAHQSSTADFWEILSRHSVYISDIVIQEAARGDAQQAQLRAKMLAGFPVLEIDDEVKELARKFLAKKLVPEKCLEDALHIAVAAINGMDVIVTWNFKHINNPVIRKRIRLEVEGNGWICPEICSPEEFLGNGDDESGE
jgi:predicted nucleic acid-binding protein